MNNAEFCPQSLLKETKKGEPGRRPLLVLPLRLQPSTSQPSILAAHKNTQNRKEKSGKLIVFTRQTNTVRSCAFGRQRRTFPKRKESSADAYYNQE